MWTGWLRIPMDCVIELDFSSSLVACPSFSFVLDDGEWGFAASVGLVASRANGSNQLSED